MCSQLPSSGSQCSVLCINDFKWVQLCACKWWPLRGPTCSGLAWEEVRRPWPAACCCGQQPWALGNASMQRRSCPTVSLSAVFVLHFKPMLVALLLQTATMGPGQCLNAEAFLPYSKLVFGLYAALQTNVVIPTRSFHGQHAARPANTTLSSASMQKRLSLTVSAFGLSYLVLRLCLNPECEGVCIWEAKQRDYPYALNVT